MRIFHSCAIVRAAHAMRDLRPALCALVALLGATACSPPPPPAPDARIAALPMPDSRGLQALAALPDPYRNADPLRGRELFSDCLDCHSFDVSVQEKGPALGGVYDHAAASRTDYQYSVALMNSKIVWDARHLDQWLFNPHEMLPATTMSYVGIRNDRKRRDVIAYLIAVTP